MSKIKELMDRLGEKDSEILRYQDLYYDELRKSKKIEKKVRSEENKKDKENKRLMNRISELELQIREKNLLFIIKKWLKNLSQKLRG